MGLRRIHSGWEYCDCWSPIKRLRNSIGRKLLNLPNPDPKNYEILQQKQVGNYSLLFVHYPDCKNFEGDKILVFKGHYVDLGELDPHFCGPSDLIARFVPTEAGVKMAFEFCEMMKRKDEE